MVKNSECTQDDSVARLVLGTWDIKGSHKNSHVEGLGFVGKTDKLLMTITSDTCYERGM